jgi:hypothetical protein
MRDKSHGLSAAELALGSEIPKELQMICDDPFKLKTGGIVHIKAMRRSQLCVSFHFLPPFAPGLGEIREMIATVAVTRRTSKTASSSSSRRRVICAMRMRKCRRSSHFENSPQELSLILFPFAW